MINLIRRLIFKLMFKRDIAMIEDFVGRFPGKCMICSYHRYGFTHGFIPLGDPVPEHHCIEKPEVTP